MSDDYTLPDLPSDEDLGIAGLSEDDLRDDAPSGETPEPPPTGRGGGGGRGGSGGEGGGAGPGGSGDGAAPPPTSPAGPAWRGPLTLFLLVLGVWLASSHRWLPSPEPANAPEAVFSSARAMTTVVEMTRRPHPPGSPEHARVRELVVDRLAELGVAPEVHTEVVVRPASDPGRPLTTATIRNVVARIPGTASTGTLLLMAHYDGRTLSRGAGDDATGVAAILETLRALQGELPLRNDILVLLTDGEELGLLGARSYVDHHLDTADVKLVLNLEMRGGGGPALMFETGAENGWAVQQLAAADPHPAATSLSVEIYRRMPNDTDYSPFRDAGVQGLNSAAIGRGNVYHQSYDDPAHLDEATVQHHGARLLALTRHLGGADLSEVQAPDRGYLVLPGLGLVHYPLSSVGPGAGALVLLLLVAVLAVALRGGGVAGALPGLLFAGATTGLSAAAAWGVFALVEARHPELGALHGAAVHEQGPYLMAFAALALAFAAALWGLLRRWAGVAALALGAAVVPTVGAVVLAFTMPGAAAVPAGPAVALLVFTLVAAVMGRRREGGGVVWGAAVVAAAGSLLVVVPVVELVADAMTLGFAVGIGALVGLSAVAVAPMLEGLRTPNRWWAPLAALGVAGAGIGVGIVRAAPDPVHPAPSTLVYVQDQGGPQRAVEAWWVGADDGSLGWAEASTGAAFEADLQNPERYGLRPGSPAAPATAVTLPPLRLRILRDTVVGSGRRVRLGVPRPRQPEALRIELGEGAGLVALDTTPLPPVGPTRPTALVHHGAPRDSLLVVEVELPLTATGVELTVQEELQRPWEVMDPAYWERGDTLAPNIVTFSDRAVIRSFHRILLAGADPGVPAATDTVGSPAPPADPPANAASPDTTRTGSGGGAPRRSEPGEAGGAYGSPPAGAGR